MEKKESLLGIIKSELDKYKIPISMPCSSSQIEIARKNFSVSLGYSPDEDYLLFIKNLNGFEFNGFTLYSFCPSETIENIIDANENWIDGDENMKEKCVFCESDLDLYIKDLASGKYMIVSKYSYDIYDRFENFLDLIEAGVKKYFT